MAVGSAKGNPGSKPRIVATYDYRDEARRLLYQVVRYEPGFDGEKKTFLQRRPDGKGGWIKGRGGVPLVLYRLPELLAAPSELIFIPEGEKDVDNLRALQCAATTNAGGAEKWRPEYNEALRGRHVVILPDNDDKGRRHAEQVAMSLAGVAASVAVVELPGLPPKGDVSDWLQVAGNDKVALLRLVQAAPRRDPAAKAHESNGEAGPETEPWENPVPLAREASGPAFPTDVLPSWLRGWTEATAEATQTPADLAGMLALALAGAALAGRFTVTVRDGWLEPLNLFVVVVLPPGERKSVVFGKALAPVQQAERDEIDRKTAAFAAAASKKRVLEARLKSAEAKAAREEDPAGRADLEQQAVRIAGELAAHVVAARPQLYCDDVTPEKLAQLLAEQGGRMLQAGPEGTAFEIAKGRYSETANFDVYLKGHSGDPLRTGRITRDNEAVDHPALSLALTVQPDVVRGLAESTTMRGRGFLARFLYALPASKVGTRHIRTRPVPSAVVADYHRGMRCVWELQPGAELHFAGEADDVLADFEGWLEPQLAEGQELAFLAGWGNKLAGAVARVAGILHVAGHISDAGDLSVEVGPQTVRDAVRFGRDYLLPHAQAAFGVMGADPRLEAARAVLRSLRELSSVTSVTIVTGVALVSRREIHRKHHRRFPKAEDLDPVLDLLVRLGWIRPHGKEPRGLGRPPSPVYQVHPQALAPSAPDTDPR
jgi:uncharacterized membrane protein